MTVSTASSMSTGRAQILELQEAWIHAELEVRPGDLVAVCSDDAVVG